MRKLIVTRGVPGCGKSTWIETMSLSEFTISPDAIRLLYSSPVLDKTGNFTISQANDKAVWKLVLDLVETRMQQGQFTVIDATHTTEKALNKYTQLAKQYHYELICVDFSNVPFDVALCRNANRESLKRVPDEVVIRMQEQIETSRIPAEYRVVSRGYDITREDSFAYDIPNNQIIHFVGDIHGCLNPLLDFLGTVSSDDMVVFVGDYLDRGPQNAEVLQLLLNLSSNPNCIFLEGNHEEHLYRWANGRDTFSKEFNTNTGLQLDAADIDKEAVRNFCRNLKECVTMYYGSMGICVTHAGLSSDQFPMALIPTRQMTHGVGEYDFAIDEAWMENTSSNLYQVHGHRNKVGIAIDEYARSFNLEGQIEFGGALRVMTLANGIWTPRYFKNNAPCPTNPKRTAPVEKAPLIERLRKDPNIKERVYGDVMSFSHKRQTAFESKKEWNSYATRARGLFIDAVSQKIIARGFDKFFYFDKNQAHKLAYPVTAQVKENGFLGLLGIHNGELFFSSKTCPTSEFTDWFKSIFYASVSNEEAEKIRQELIEKDCCLVFEVIDVDNDPHIIAYEKSHLVLLAAVKCQEEFEKVKFDSWTGDRVQVAFAAHNERELTTVLGQDDDRDKRHLLSGEVNRYDVEGWVLIDANGQMSKVKSPIYSFWKDARSIKEKMITAKVKGLPYSRGWEHFKNCPMPEVSVPLVEWMWDQSAEFLGQDIITVRGLYLT